MDERPYHELSPNEKRKRTLARNRAAAKVNGVRLRRRRLEAGLSQAEAARGARTDLVRWQHWELGIKPYPACEVPAIASALGIPIASLLTDELVLTEIRVSDETLERVKREGRPAAAAIVAAIVPGLEAALLAAATRPPVDTSPYAWARPRRSREQVLAGSRQAA